MSQTPLEIYNQRLKEGIFEVDPEQEGAIGSLERLYQDLIGAANTKKWKIWEKAEAPKGVYLYGGVGRGKSMLMDLFYECLPEDIPKRRVHFHAFMIDVHDYFHSRRAQDDFSEGIDEALPALATLLAGQSRVLCFDEFHVTDVADAMILGRLFTALFDYGVVVVATSNWEPDRLYEGGLQRDRFLPFIELLKTRMEIVHLEGGLDYRARCLQEEGTYFWPLGKKTAQKLDEVFTHLTDHAVPYEEELEVKSRTIPVRAVAKNAARFMFSELCEQAYGAEDYLKIAATYSTIFLEDVPKLTEEQRNEAKRLMTLIDALYESGTKLVVTAAASPEDLYSGHDHGFEFQRTASRLLEMQSEKYLAKL